MYEKNLKEDLRLRLSKDDMDFLRGLSEKRCVSVSECIRSIISEYRRSLAAMDILSKAIELSASEKGELSKNGDTKTYIDNQL